MNLLRTLIALACFVAPGLTIRVIRQDTPTTTTTTTATTATSQTTDRASNRTGSMCVGPDFKEGVCMPPAQCPGRYEANLKNDLLLIVFEDLLDELCSNDTSLVCCPNAVQHDAENREIPITLPSMADGCGHVSRRYRKAVGGVSSKVGAWPWMALLHYDEKYYDPYFKCGGTLITSRHVLTAAHCILDGLDFVRLGEHDLSTDTESQHIDVPIVDILKHPGFDPEDYNNDIALLFLGENVQFSERISPICIPFDAKLRSKNYTGFETIVAGWGYTKENGTLATVLQEIQIPVLNIEVCREAFIKANESISSSVLEHALCAGDLSGGKDACTGDSGGPLMLAEEYENSHRYHVLGVVSYGVGCARPEIPGIYTRVSNYIEWIEYEITDIIPYIRDFLYGECDKLLEKKKASGIQLPSMDEHFRYR